jgi:glycosyltransferase involved in cell wall biosynthesis
MRGESNLLVERPFWIRAAKRYGIAPLLRRLGGALAIGSLNREFYRHCGVPEERIFLAPYTVDNGFFQQNAGQSREQAAALREQFGVEPDDLVVLFAAKLIPVKGCADLIRAFAARPREKTTLVIAGEGPLRRELVDLAARFPDRSVRFVGFMNQSQMPAVYALGDVFVIPSNQESWGLAVNEAMNLACPIIASDQVGCAPDLVSSENGWIFPAENVQALDAVLTEALADRDILDKKGQASLARIENWDIRHTADGFFEGTRAVTSSRL